MTNRRLATCLVFTSIGLVCAYAQSETEGGSDSSKSIAALQQERIDLLEKRVSQFQVLAEHGLIDSGARIRPQMDLIEAKLEYAKSNEEKQMLLNELLAKYDALIELAEVASAAPASPPQLGRRPGLKLTPENDVLWLKAERVRVQILQDELD